MSTSTTTSPGAPKHRAGDGIAVEEQAPSSRHLAWALVLISVAQLMVVLDASIANIALPFIKSDLDISQANLSWIVTGYSLAFGGLLLLGGRLGDLYGRRRMFMVGVSVFAVASLLGGLATTEPLLLGARGLQGLGAAIASPAALALITTTFPAGPQRNRAFSVYAAMSGAGAAVGLVLGGWLTGLEPTLFGHVVDGWRLTFLINVPIGLIAAALAPAALRESESHPGELDLPGALSGTLGLVGVVYGLTRAGDARYGFGDPWTLVSLALGLALLAAFVLIERHVSHPLLPFRILASRTRATSFVVMMLVPAAMFAMFYFLSQVVQNVMGYSPLHTGFAFLPFSAGIVLGATVSSKLMERVAPRWIAGVGTLMALIALLGFSRLPYNDSLNQLSVNIHYASNVLPWILLMSIGMGLTFVPLTLTAVHGVGARDSGIGSGVLNTMQQVGGALGLATLSTVAVHFTSDKAASLVAAAKSAGGSADPSQLKRLEGLVQQVAFTEGATRAFFAGAIMIGIGCLVVVTLMNVGAEELATDEPPEGVGV